MKFLKPVKGCSESDRRRIGDMRGRDRKGNCIVEPKE
jgi:hypothetical protein